MPTACSSSGVLGSVDVDDDAAGERRGLDEVQMP
jgi:hypothetical protein